MMQIVDSLDKLNNLGKGWVVTIGNFDGVHVGHQEILRTARQIAEEKKARGVAVMTFHPHPVAILRPDKAPGVLTPLELKQKLIGETGVDCLVVLKDSLSLLNMSPEAFVSEFLMKTAQPIAIVEGTNFNFGYGRSGNIDTLVALGNKFGFDVQPIPLARINFSDDSQRQISSSLIRELVEHGNMDDAAAALSRPYRLIGEVGKGRGVGRKIGFPTINLIPGSQIIPGEGVYAGTVQLGDNFNLVCSGNQKLPAVFSIGRAKTFSSEIPLLIEAHILDSHGTDISDLTGKWAAMDFVGNIRSQQVFDSPQHLVEQIRKDCQSAHKILAEHIGT